MNAVAEKQGQAEETLRQSEMRFRSVVEGSMQGIMVRSGERIEYANPACARIFGYSSPEELVGQPWHFLVAPEELPSHEARAAAILRGQAVPPNPCWQGIRKDGTRIWLESGARPFIWEGQDAILAFVTDITERKQAQDALREREELYRLLTDNSNDLVYLLDIEGRVVYASPSIERLGGVAVSQVVGTSALAAMHPEDKAAVREAWGRVLAGENATATFRLQHGDGTWRWIETLASPVLYQGLPHIMAVGRDLTERKRAEEELVLFRALIDRSNDAIEIVDPRTGRFLDVNEKACQAHGYRRQEYLALTVSDIDPVTAATPWPEIVEKVRASGSLVMEGKHKRKDGSIFPVEVHVNYIRLNRDYMLAVARDITERKRVEETLRAAQQRLQHVVASSPAVLYTLAVKGDTAVPTWASDNMRAVLGYSLAEALEANFWQAHVHPDDREWVSAKVRQQLLEHGSATNEYRFRHRDGQYRWIRSEKRLLRDAAGQPVEIIGSWSDITERKLLEDQFRQAQKMEAIGRLAGGVAHDFNNLLTVISGYSNLLLANLRKEDPLRLPLEEISKAGDRAAALTRQLLAFSRKQMLLPVALDLNVHFKEIEKMLSRLIGEDITLVFSGQPSLWKVKVDPGQMEQIIMNLVVNSRDAMPKGGNLTIETRNVELDDCYARAHPEIKPGQYVLFAVSDTGCGMDEATRSLIFEPFFTTKGPEKGTGLGLAMVFGIVKQSGGGIGVYSEPNVGTTIKVYLPRAEPQPPKSQTPSSHGRPRIGTERVLLVEDDDGIRKLARLMLENQGYQVLAARNAAEAFSLCQHDKEEIHILVTDVVLPKMSGPELAKELKALRPNMRILFMSGYMDDAVIQHGMIDPDTPFLAKPFTSAGLIRKVREVLDMPWDT